MQSKINTIDLFAGCGGLMDGFEQSGLYNTLACVEWEKAPCENLKKRLTEKWNYQNSDRIVLRFDIRRSEELFSGWENDEVYGSSLGLDKTIGNKNVDVIIGGPPCQAYSLAGRIRDDNGMINDYRNFLFENYIEVIKHYKPKAFVFENVPGILSAKPTGDNITDIIINAFNEAGYIVANDFSETVVNFAEYGIPQNRKRVIIVGLSKEEYGKQAKEMLTTFYNKILPSNKTEPVTVREAIADLPKLYPLDQDVKIGGKRYSHTYETNVKNHTSRWHSERDIATFSMLAEDIESGRKHYTSANALKELYTKLTGRESNVHKYYVIRWDEQSNLIPAHLYKDGLRHIHPDSMQARSITVREAARLQGFDDDYEFIGSQGEQFKMIGNAVPPKFSTILANCIYELLVEKE